MAKTVVLRKCNEHGGCQLQRVNDGDWEHTPESKPIIERLQDPSANVRVLERLLTASLEDAEARKRRLEAEVERASGKAEHLDARGLELRHLEEHLASSMGDAAELVVRLTERAVRASALLDRLDEGIDRLARVEAVYQAVADADAARRTDSKELHDRLNALQHALDQERTERLQATYKGERTARLLAGRIEEVRLG